MDLCGALTAATQGYPLGQVYQKHVQKVLIARLARVPQSSAILGHIPERDKEAFAASHYHAQ